MTDPTIGQIVHYRLTREDASTANWQRVRAHEHLAEHRKTGVQWHEGWQHHAGDVVPLMIVSVTPWKYSTNTSVCLDYTPDVEPEWSFPLSHFGASGQAFLLGNDVLFVNEAPHGEFRGAWCYLPGTSVANVIPLHDGPRTVAKVYDIGELERVSL